MSTLERAIQIEATGHAGQADKAGVHYIRPPLSVRNKLVMKDLNRRFILEIV